MSDDFGVGRKTFMGGFIVGFLVAGLLAILVGQSIAARQGERARRGWNLEMVITATRDIPACTTLELDMVQQQPIPEQFVTESMARPESVNHLLGQTVHAPIQRGDPILWALLQATACGGEAEEPGEGEADEEPPIPAE